MTINKPRGRSVQSWTLGDAVEAQFDELDRGLGHITRRGINVYNQIVYMVKLMKGDK